MLPSSVSTGGDNDMAFTFNVASEIVVTVAGGATYQHRLWNYGHDSLVVQKKILGVPYHTVSYLVDRRMSSKHHGLVLLTPQGEWGLVGSLLTQCLSGNVLRRLEVCQDVFGVGKFLRLKVMVAKELYYSTGRPGDYNSATITATADDALAAYARVTKTKLSPAGVNSIIPKLLKSKTYILTEYHRACTKTHPDTVFSVSQGVLAYQYDPINYDPDAKMCSNHL
jgi:hypothetical protein